MLKIKAEKLVKPTNESNFDASGVKVPLTPLQLPDRTQNS